MRIPLTGDGLTVEKVWAVAVENAEVEIAPEADERLVRSRKLVYDLVERNVPIYGFNTGVGWNKDHKIDKSCFEKFNRDMIYSHTMGIRPEASQAEVRAAMVVRLNCLLRGNTGIQPEVARHYALMLNARLHPVIPERGAVGEGDISLLSHIGLAMMGEGLVDYQGRRMSSAEAHREAGLPLVELGPKDALAIISSNAFAAGQAALLLKDMKDLADLSDIVYAVSLEALNGNTSPLDPDVMAARRMPGQTESASRIRKYIEGSFLYDPDPTRALQDPLCFRGGAHVNGTLRDAIDYAEKYLYIQMNSSDDNPCVLLERETILSNSNFEVTTQALAFEMLGLAVSHLSRLSCYRMIKLGNPSFTGLSRFLSHDGEVHCFGAFQKAFTALDTEIRHLSNPCTVDYLPLAGEIEDHASNFPTAVQKLRKMVDNLKYIYGMEMIHSAQAIDLRLQKGPLRLGRGTEIAWREFRKRVGFYKNERPLSPDIEKAHDFIADGTLLKTVRDAFL